MGPPARVNVETGNASGVATTRKRNRRSEWKAMLPGIHHSSEFSAHCFEVRNWRTDRSARLRARTALSAKASVHSPMPDPGGRICQLQYTEHEMHPRAAGGSICLSHCRAVKRELHSELPGAVHSLSQMVHKGCGFSSYPARAAMAEGREISAVRPINAIYRRRPSLSISWR